MSSGDPPARPPRPELFHTIADPASAEARRLVIELGLEKRVRLRNVHYSEVEQDLKARGGAATPALWSDGRLVEGLAEVAAALAALAQPAG